MEVSMIRSGYKPGWGGSRIKVTGMLVVSLRGVNCRFWFHMGVWNRKSLYLPIQVSLRAVHTEIYKTIS